MPVTIALPDALRHALATQADPTSAASAQRLSERYRADTPATAPIIATTSDAEGYLLTRMPATFAAARFVLSQLAEVVDLAPTSLLDLGAGTGAASWAAWDTFETLTDVELLDYSWPALTRAAGLLATTGLTVTTHLADISPPTTPPGPKATPVSLGIAAYVLSELDEAARTALVATLTDRASDAVVILEPGTPAGYRRILRVREQLLTLGWRIAAPCPHELTCPIAAREGDWCHAAVRLPRTRAHRAAKHGERDFEDEKVSWVAALPPRATGSAGATAPQPPAPAPDPARPARVLRHPRTHSGHIQLELCTRDGAALTRTITKRDKPAFRAARKVEWGEAWWDGGEPGQPGSAATPPREKPAVDGMEAPPS